jgi:hypothetical protein
MLAGDRVDCTTRNVSEDYPLESPTVFQPAGLPRGIRNDPGGFMRSCCVKRSNTKTMVGRVPRRRPRPQAGIPERCVPSARTSKPQSACGPQLFDPAQCDHLDTCHDCGARSGSTRSFQPSAHNHATHQARGRLLRCYSCWGCRATHDRSAHKSNGNRALAVARRQGRRSVRPPQEHHVAIERPGSS